MSREFHVISPQMWNDDRFVALSDEAKLLWIRFLTGPEVTIVPGVIAVGRAAFAEAMDWSLPKFDRAFSQLAKPSESHAHPMAIADWRARVVWLPNACKHRRPPKNPNEVTSWRDYWRIIPDCQPKRDAGVSITDFLRTKGDGFSEAFQSIFVIGEPSKTPKLLGTGDRTTVEQPPNSQPTTLELAEGVSARARACARSDSVSFSESSEIAHAPAEPDGVGSQTPAAWWEGVVATVRAIPVPVEEPGAWWVEYCAAMHRKRWPVEHQHAVGWLTSAARRARDEANRKNAPSADRSSGGPPPRTSGAHKPLRSTFEASAPPPASLAPLPSPGGES